MAAGSLGWDVVPVIVQDPRWEQSFPDVGGLALPLAAPGRREPQLVRLSRREAAARRDANEVVWRGCSTRSAGSSSTRSCSRRDDRSTILDAFLRWHERRDVRVRQR